MINITEEQEKKLIDCSDCVETDLKMVNISHTLIYEYKEKCHLDLDRCDSGAINNLDVVYDLLQKLETDLEKISAVLSDVVSLKF